MTFVTPTDSDWETWRGGGPGGSKRHEQQPLRHDEESGDYSYEMVHGRGVRIFDGGMLYHVSLIVSSR